MNYLIWLWLICNYPIKPRASSLIHVLWGRSLAHRGTHCRRLSLSCASFNAWTLSWLTLKFWFLLLPDRAIICIFPFNRKLEYYAHITGEVCIYKADAPSQEKQLVHSSMYNRYFEFMQLHANCKHGLTFVKGHFKTEVTQRHQHLLCGSLFLLCHWIKKFAPFSNQTKV